MGNEGEGDLSRASSSARLHNIFTPTTTISQQQHNHLLQNPNPNHSMTSQNPNYEPRQFYNPRLNPNADEYYHQLMGQHHQHALNSTTINGGSGGVTNLRDDDQSLAAAFGMLNLYQAPAPPVPVANGPGFGAIARPGPPSLGSGFLCPTTLEQEYDYHYLQYVQDLYKKRIESAVKGQHSYNIMNSNGSGTSSNFQIMSNDLLGILGGGGSLDHHLQSGSQLPLLNPFSINNNYSRPTFGRKYSNTNGSRRDLGGRRGRSANRSILEMSSLASSSSSLYNHRKRPSYSSLEELKGKIGLAAKEQHGCSFLQEKLEHGNRDEIEFIFSEIVDCLQDLIVDQFGNYLIQKLFEVCNEAQITKILYSPAISNEKKLMAICTNDHGTRTIQKLLEYVTTMEQKSIIVSSLSRIGLPLMKDQRGNHVIQQCFKLFPVEDAKYLLHQVAENCLDLALDRQGCCVLQLCLSHTRGEYRDRLLAEIAANSLALSVNCFGNYVLQFVLELEIPEATASIVSQLYGNYVTLSMSKCASNVVEKCLQEAREEQCTMIIHELLSSPNFLNVCQDSYGNYVVQTALKVSKGDVHKCLANHIVKVLYPFLQSHPHGKNVLQEAKPSKHRSFNKRK